MSIQTPETLTVNGTSRPWVNGLTVGQLIASLNLNPEAVVVERNGDILPRGNLLESPLAAGDSVEILHFVGGG